MSYLRIEVSAFRPNTGMRIQRASLHVLCTDGISLAPSPPPFIAPDIITPTIKNTITDGFQVWLGTLCSDAFADEG